MPDKYYSLKIDMVNDVDAHFGRITNQEGFGNVALGL